MYPTLLMLYPELARSLVLYRFQRMGAARENAKTHNVSGRSADLGGMSAMKIKI
jgi:trehalose/maltose hydrolase-like predicted phosphorylase